MAPLRAIRLKIGHPKKGMSNNKDAYDLYLTAKYGIKQHLDKPTKGKNAKVCNLNLNRLDNPD